MMDLGLIWKEEYPIYMSYFSISKYESSKKIKEISGVHWRLKL